MQEIQVVIFYAFNKKMLNELTIPEVKIFQEEILAYIQKKKPDLLKLLREKRKLEPDVEKGIVEVVEPYVKDLIGRRKKDTPDELDEYADEVKSKPEAAEVE
jgi:F-type H+-transporting ATPase subunit alpha